MIVSLLLIVFASLMALIALGLTIGGLIKNRKGLWISSLTAFVLFSLLSVFSIYTYVKESIYYMGTDDFQQETKKKAEYVGKTWGSTVSGTAQGLAATLDDEAIAKLAGKGAIIVGKGVKAAATGLDETTGNTTVFSDESLDKAGIKIGRAQELSDSNKFSYGLYLEFQKDFKGKLKLTAFDSKGLKMDNSILSFQQKMGEDKVFRFQFDYFKTGLSGYCILSKVE